jgi:hypothetical protein
MPFKMRGQNYKCVTHAIQQGHHRAQPCMLQLTWQEEQQQWQDDNPTHAGGEDEG